MKFPLDEDCADDADWASLVESAEESWDREQAMIEQGCAQTEVP